MGELALSPVGLSAMTTLAPRRFVGQMMGMWFLCTALGSARPGLIAGRSTPSRSRPGRANMATSYGSRWAAASVLLLLAKPLAAARWPRPVTTNEQTTRRCRS